MDHQDLVAYTTQAFNKVAANNVGDEAIWTEEQVNAISQASAGHPLTAARTASFILTNLAEEYGEAAVEEFIKNNNTALREEQHREQQHALLLHKPPLQQSILENFDVSRTRLPDPNGHAWILMKLIAFLSLENGTFHQFLFLKRPWITELKDQLTYYEIWSAKHDLRRWMSELVQVSFGSRKSIGDVLRFHPVLIQCIQEQVGHDEKIQILRDILLLAYESCMRIECLPAEAWDSSTEMLDHQARHCRDLFDAWLTTRGEQNLPDHVYQWFENDESDLATAMHTQIPDPTTESYQIKEELAKDQLQCEETEALFTNLAKNFSNQEASQAGRSKFNPTILRLEEMDQRILDLPNDEMARDENEELIAMVDKVYSVAIRLAQHPIMHSHMLGEELMNRKRKVLASLNAHL
jgi:hypothetical protein